MTPIVIEFLSFLTLLGNIGIIVFAFSGISKQWVGFSNTVWNFITKTGRIYGLIFAYIVSAIATLGSLFLSEVAHFTPCLMCWYQRIFMYPQVVILLVALVSKFTKEVKSYCIALSSIGFVIALYHYYLQLFGDPSTPCSSVGVSVSCSQTQFTHFGYITIPFMAATAFLLIILSMIYFDKGK